MREHAIPQAVTSYEFHLIGNMTLKQFLELAAGFVLGFVVYSTNLPGIIKWPIIIFFVALGAMLAFVPFEGRPLDQWFVALIRAIYKPTEFYWRKSEEIPDFLTYTSSSVKTYEPELDLTPAKQQRIREYITTIPTKPQMNPLDAAEFNRVSSVLSLFDQITVTEVDVNPNFVKPSVADTNTHTLQPVEKIFEDSQPATVPTPAPLSIPENSAVQVSPVQTTQPPQPQENLPELATETVNVFSSTTLTPEVPQTSQQATTSADLPFPQRPTQPNIVVGMVFDPIGNIVENAIIEITDQQGLPVRAVKTNIIGQFSISTPLKDGNYFLNIEKEGLQFTPIQISLQNTIIDPLDIRAQA